MEDDSLDVMAADGDDPTEDSSDPEIIASKKKDGDDNIIAVLIG